MSYSPAGGANSSGSGRRSSAVREACNSPDARIDALALSLVPRVGARAHWERSQAYGSAAHAFTVTVPPGQRPRLRDEATRIARDGDACGARLLLREDADYPAPLLELYDPPPYLFVLGDLGLLARPTVAIVGTRRATAYGERTTDVIATALATAGAGVVSGMARGIDAAAHRAALRARGVTVAVLGTGVDVAYPVAHRSLHRAIVERGLVLSEFPCGSGAAPASFPRRNRIIAALARLTLVIEAGDRSGALITADHAMDLGRDIGAVPGPVDSPQCVGSNRLIQTGAHAVLDSGDALSLMGLADPASRSTDISASLSGDERVVWLALAAGATALDTLTELTALAPSRALAAVTVLELGGLIETLPSGEVRRRRG
jgi:DNA processing protein